MSKINMYRDLVKCKVFNAVDVENTKVYENDIVIDDESINVNREFKVETDNMTDEEVIIALLAKQNFKNNQEYIKLFRNIDYFFCFYDVHSTILKIVLKYE